MPRFAVMLHGEGISIPSEGESPIVGFYVWRHANGRTSDEAGRKAVMAVQEEIAGGAANGAQVHVEETVPNSWWAGRVRRAGFIFYQQDGPDDEPEDCPLRGATKGVGAERRRRTPAPRLDEWFRVSWDTDKVTLDVAPPGRDAWSAEFAWDSISRVCFKAEGLELSDGIYVFTVVRPESYVIPVDAAGGAGFWNEVIRRGLFDAELAVEAASAAEGLYCWPRT